MLINVTLKSSMKLKMHNCNQERTYYCHQIIEQAWTYVISEREQIMSNVETTYVSYNIDVYWNLDNNSMTKVFFPDLDINRNIHRDTFKVTKLAFTITGSRISGVLKEWKYPQNLNMVDSHVLKDFKRATLQFWRADL